MRQDPLEHVDALRRRLQADRRLAEKLDAALDAIGFDQAFAEEAVTTSGRRKFVKDSVWGMVDFDSAEIRLIDSPLLQRLRNVRQLGFSYLVYPSAEHTRFIHSLGMAHVVSRFADSITRNADTLVSDQSQVKAYVGLSSLFPLDKRELVFAALLHDVGHLPFSHACEAALTQRDGDFTLAGEPLGEFLTGTRYAFDKMISLSEALSILVVLSKRFSDFYARLTGKGPTDAAASLVRIACLIAGAPATKACPNIQDLISAAAVDADKIDYVARDASACGIAVGVDTSRIFMGSGLVQAKREAYELSYRGDGVGTLFIVNSSGADTLDEIVQARSALYQRVYLHPVTRTAEALLARALHLNVLRAGYRRSDLVDVLDLWAMDDASLLHALGDHGDPDVKGLARRLRRRDLPKKACALAGSLATIQMPLRSVFPKLDSTAASTARKDLANTFIEKLRRDNIAEIGTSKIEARIKEAADALAKALREGGRADLVPTGALDLVVVTPIAAMDASRPDALVFQAGELIKTPALTNVQGQHDAQDIFKAVGYVFCDPEWRMIVLAAARRVVFEMSEETSPDPVNIALTAGDAPVKVAAKRRTLLEFEGVTRRANISRSSATAVMRGAAEVGHFDDLPILYVPTNVDHADVMAAAATFRSFVGEQGWSVDRVTVAAFVDQFPARLREELLDKLRRGVMLDQGAIAESLRVAIATARTGDEAVALCPLSYSSGGGAVAIARSLNLPGVTCCSNLKEALAGDSDRYVLLVDDNASSGVQASAQLHAHARTPHSDRPERLQREKDLFEEELGLEDIERLKATRIGIAVAVGQDGADTYVREVATSLGLARFEGVRFGTRIAAGLDWSDPLRNFLVDVGRELLAHRYEGRPFADVTDPGKRSQCDERAFGYGSQGGIMATHGNVPSSTVTAIWQPGVVRGRPWMPLMIRRGLLKDLVLG